ncbi:MAG: hypothetical protein RL431_628 [Actinomycetota bacterium]
MIPTEFRSVFTSTLRRQLLGMVLFCVLAMAPSLLDPAPASATIAVMAPAAPAGLSVTGSTARSLNVEWPAVESSTQAPVQGYRIEYRTPNGVWTVGAETAADRVAATITALEPSTRYELRVAATNDAGVGAYFVYGAPISLDMSPSALCLVRSNHVVNCDGIDRNLGVDAVSVSVGFDHYCALTVEGARCWGGNTYGQLGLGHVTSAPGYTQPISVSESLQDIQAFGYSTCALTSTNALWCWGKNNWGRTGLAASARFNPSPVLVSSNVVDFVVGTDLCFVTIDEATHCEDGFYAGSRRTTYSSFGPSARIFGPVLFCTDSAPATVSCATSTSDTPGISRVWPNEIREMEVGGLHTCAVTIAAELWCSGNNSHGELGQGFTSTGGSSNPIIVPGIGTVTHVAIEPVSGSNRYRTCASNTESVVYCWGADNPTVRPKTTLPVITATTADLPQTVTGLQQAGNTANSTTVSWTAARPTTYGATEYTVNYSRDGQTWNSLDAGTSTSWTFHDLPSAAALLYTVTTRSGSERSRPSATAIAFTRGTRTAQLTVTDGAGEPVIGGSLSWINSTRTIRSASPLGLTSAGLVSFPLIPAGPITFTLSGVTLPSGATATATITEVIGLETPTVVRIPAEPSEARHIITVQLPNGEPVVGAEVTVAGLVAESRNETALFTAPTLPLSGFTDENGSFLSAGYIGADGATATIHYNDGVLEQTVTADVDGYVTVVVLDEMPYVVVPEQPINATAGSLVSVTMTVRDTAALSPRARVTVVPPAGAPQVCRGAKLSGTPDLRGNITVKLCATKSGKYSVRGTGIASTGSVMVSLKGSAASGVTQLKAQSPTAGTARVTWQAPALSGGLKVTEYIVLMQGAGSTVTLRTTKLTANFSRLRNATTYSVTVIPVTKAGNGTRIKTTVPVA